MRNSLIFPISPEIVEIPVLELNEVELLAVIALGIRLRLEHGESGGVTHA